MTLSASEQILLLSHFVHDQLTGKKPPGILFEGTPTGPVRLATTHNRVVVSLDQVERALEDVIGYLESHGRIPDAVWLGPSAVGPESFLLSLVRIAIGLSSGASPSGTVTFEPAGLPAAQYVRNNRDLWGWIIFPPGFEAPEMMKLAKRQVGR